MPEERQRELAALREIILPAGAQLLAEQGRLREIAYKSATEVVTDLDRALEERLVAALGQHFPEDAVVAEEGASRAGGSGRTWYIDPIDGTTNFIHGYPFYSVSMACTQGDDLLLGAVFAPYLDELYLAARGGGARLARPRGGTEQPLLPRGPVIVTRALLATGFPYVRDGLVTANAYYLQRFLMLGCHDVRRGGSAAIDLCHVAAGKLDGYWEMSLRPWDVAAGTLIAREAGALVSDFEGRSGFLGGQSVVAAAPGLHEEMLAVLREGWRGSA